MTIEAKKLLKIYGKRKVVNEVSISVNRGEVVGLLGPNGAGKTTSFYMIVGLIKPNKGNIFLDDKNISKFPMHKRSRLGLGYLPQEASVFRKLTVEQNILAIWQLRGGAPKLNLLEKIELSIRKRERSWWKRSKYDEDYQIFLGTIKKSINDIDRDRLIGGTNIDPKELKIAENNLEKIRTLEKIILNLELNYEQLKERVVNFYIEFNKKYDIGKKKKINDFLNDIWKEKRDQIAKEIFSGNETERINLVKKLFEVRDLDPEEFKEKIIKQNKFENVNEISEFIFESEKEYWKEKKLELYNAEEELSKIEKLSKDKKKISVEQFMAEIGLKENQINDVLDSMTWSKKKSQDKQLDDLLDEFNITHIRKSKGSDLSGGERRRVEIARAVANKPSFLLLDEPFAGIDPIAVSGIKQMIFLLKNRNIGVLITDHNVRETLQIIDRGYILSDGKVIEEGTREHIANSEIARKHYLGEDFSLD